MKSFIQFSSSRSRPASQERGGMRVPLDGEVAWLLDEGEKPYWRGHIAEISFEFAR